MQQFSITIEPGLVKLVDKIVKYEGLYCSRNDFVRDAIRSKVLEFRRLMLRKELEKMAKTAVGRGWNGELLTKKERKIIADEFLKEKGLK